MQASFFFISCDSMVRGFVSSRTGINLKQGATGLEVVHLPLLRKQNKLRTSEYTFQSGLPKKM